MPISLQRAQTLIAAAHEHATTLRINVTVAVVDEGGHLVALGRMDGAFALSPQIAEAKAVGAAVWYRDGASLAGLREQRPAFFDAVDRLTRLPLIPGLGSVILREGGRVLGAVGVSGASSEQDLACAVVGLRAIGLQSDQELDNGDKPGHDEQPAQHDRGESSPR
jgi:glc operon protein GlcG